MKFSFFLFVFLGVLLISGCEDEVHMLNQTEQKALERYLVNLKNSSKFEEDYSIFYPGAATGEMKVMLNIILNQSIENILKVLKENPSKKSIIKQVEKDLRLYPKNDIDTEDRERICEYYYEVGKVGNLEDSLKKILNVWLYGFLGYFIK